jgi:undecaprenyl-diphosphatase
VLKFKLTKALLLTMLGVIGFSFLAVLTLRERLYELDAAVITAVQGLESSALTPLMKFFSNIGSTGGVIVLAALILWYLVLKLRHRAEAWLFFGVVAGSAALNQAMKFAFQRPRPDLHRLVDAYGYSFPSGHSMSAFALYGILTFLLWRHIPAAWGRVLIIAAGVAITFLIGGSRIYLGVHYPTDVFGGYAAGGFWLAASIYVYQKLAEQRYEHKVATS